MRNRCYFLTLLLLASCSGGGGGSAPPPSNSPPVFTSLQTASIIENATAAYQALATDPDGDALTFSLYGGADAGRFAISAAGALTFTPVPDYDLPTDGNGDNTYNVIIRVSDGRNSTTQIVNITVNNSREGIAVRRVATGFTQPVFVAALPGDERLLVAEKGGKIYYFDPFSGQRVLVRSLSNISSSGERGLLGLMTYGNFGLTVRMLAVVTATDGSIEVRDLLYSNAGSTAIPRPDATVLSIPHPNFDNHNGGWIGYGDDGNVYLAVGDGGGSGDPSNNAQNPNSRLGKILRFRLNGTDAVPAISPASGNPYIAGGGDPYVYALGLRNPFRASSYQSNLIIGDVGQEAIEEIDLLSITQPGTNFGWPFREGTQTYAGSAPRDLTQPVAEYAHGSGPQQGGSVIGGYVYTGRIASLSGHYIFGDFVSKNIWSVPYSTFISGQTLSSSKFARRNEDFTPDVGSIDQLVSFGINSIGDVFLVDFDGDIFMIVPA